LLDKVDHGVRLGHAVTDGVLRHDDAGHADDTAAAVSLQKASQVYVSKAWRMFGLRQEFGVTVWSCHA
jgi:hypothetical protein